MEQNGSSTQSFIIKIWLEESLEETGHAVWRGHITHVSTGERRYLQNLDAFPLFIGPYLEKIGVKVGLYWRSRLYLNRVKRHRGRR